MKRIMILLFAVALVLFGCASNGSSDNGAEGKKTVENPGNPEEPAAGPKTEAVRGTPSAIDGTMDPVFEGAPVIETAMYAVGDESAATATARLAWDDEYLYAYIEVEDPLLSDKNSNVWEQDSVEIYIDEMNKKSQSYVAGIAQYRVNYNNVVTGGTGANLDMFSSGVQIVDGGYNVTVAMPFTMGTPQANTWVGFDFQVNDDGKGDGVRSGVVDWANDTNMNYQNASKFGSVKLLP